MADEQIEQIDNSILRLIVAETADAGTHAIDIEIVEDMKEHHE